MRHLLLPREFSRHFDWSWRKICSTLEYLISVHVHTSKWVLSFTWWAFKLILKINSSSSSIVSFFASDMKRSSIIICCTHIRYYRVACLMRLLEGLERKSLFDWWRKLALQEIKKSWENCVYALRCSTCQFACGFSSDLKNISAALFWKSFL